MFWNRLEWRVLWPPAILLLAAALLAPTTSNAQNPKRRGEPPRPDFIPADYDDYQNMLTRLGIHKMRGGRNGRAADTTDDAVANPYKDSMPKLMVFNDGTKVTSADQWPRRRAEIVEDFEREVYGRVPKNAPAVKWEVTSTVEGESGGIAMVTKTLEGRVDNSGFPKIAVTIQASFTVPKDAAGHVPIIVQFGGGFGFGGRLGANPWTQQALDKSWGYGTINPNSIQGDNSRLREGIIGLTNKGQPRSPEDWGALRAWAWGVSRLIDYFAANTDSGVDAAKVCITGVSRYGKAALVATAFEPRVAAGFVASSGTGGAALFRRNFGESLENLAARSEYHWMAGNFLKYAADEAKFGKKTVADLPVDQHELIALCAPRPCFISYGILPGDPNWVDAHGSFMAAVLAGPAYRLLGKKDLGTVGDYLTDKMPPVNSLIGGELAWRQHDGGHTNVPNFPAFFEWTGRYISSPGLLKKKQANDEWPKEITNSIGMKLVRIPAGKFTMGSTKKEQDGAIADFEKIYGKKASDTESGFYRVEGPRHEVEITKPFWLGIHEVTQGQFEKVMGYNPSYFSRDGKGKTGVKYTVKPAEGKDKTPADTTGYPVENVAWDEAENFCQKLTNKEGAGRMYRLPTEAEWEYSCRGGADAPTVFHFGDSLSSTQANFDGNYPAGGSDTNKYLEGTSKVGSYKMNAFGLYDMHGNTWEWCADWFGSDYYEKSPLRDPPGPTEGSMRVYRGGSWYDTAQNCRSAFRGRNPPEHRNNNVGFRVALVPSGK